MSKADMTSACSHGLINLEAAENTGMHNCTDSGFSWSIRITRWLGLISLLWPCLPQMKCLPLSLGLGSTLKLLGDADALCTMKTSRVDYNIHHWAV